MNYLVDFSFEAPLVVGKGTYKEMSALKEELGGSSYYRILTQDELDSTQ